ncbi:hypothetical protein QBC46DRAFT_379305 [Diplogelasinospora grovesii]|uniref:Polyketide synthase n=1 Tax=Diplogelasinospora grovesii TaxID=303347 RepID=A0AAN6S6C0_9PEZI|nr:hypothetical protein QBC46DRAFT_379305 [Diplogelasinospora grovesii]
MQLIVLSTLSCAQAALTEYLALGSKEIAICGYMLINSGEAVSTSLASYVERWQTSTVHRDICCKNCSLMTQLSKPISKASCQVSDNDLGDEARRT